LLEALPNPQSGEMPGSESEEAGRGTGTIIVIIVFALLVAGGILLILAGRQPG
jgi:hypothetical protein